MWFLSAVAHNSGVLRDTIEKQKRKSILNVCRTVAAVGTRTLLTFQTPDLGRVVVCLCVATQPV